MSTTTSPNVMEQLDLRKKKVLDLTKEKGLDGQRAQVAFVCDFSGSMSGLYRNGTVQRVAERLLPLGLVFDDNKEIDMFLFHDGVIELPDTVKRHNIVGYVDTVTKGKDMGSTSYSPFIKAIVRKYGSPKPLAFPVYVIVIVDGGCDDTRDAEKAMKDASEHGIFFQFIGIGGANFAFLEKLDDLKGRFIDNANFFEIKDIDKVSDDDLYKGLFKEFPSYVVEARKKGLIK